MQIHVAFRYNLTGVPGEGRYGSTRYTPTKNIFPPTVEEFVRMEAAVRRLVDTGPKGSFTIISYNALREREDEVITE